MSKETVQFVEMARQAKDKTVTLPRFCERCQTTTDHLSKQEGNWEHLACTSCGIYRQFKTK